MKSEQQNLNQSRDSFEPKRTCQRSRHLVPTDDMPSFVRELHHIMQQILLQHSESNT